MGESFIPLSVPNLKGNELAYVVEAVETEWVSTGGPFVTEFEEKIANYVNAKGAVACQSGTAGLHLALEICGVKAGDEVIVPTLTFIAAVNPVKYMGAEPIFMDCDESLCLDPDKVQDFCREECDFIEGQLINRLSGKVIKALIVVHVFGNMASMEKLKVIAEKYNLKIIEDATEAMGTYYLGGKYINRFAGTIGDVGIYSFNGNKIITTGGGGMLVSNDQELLDHARHLSTQAKSDEIYYTHDEIGYNYRMTNLQAALGLGQLEQLELFIESKKANYNLYKNEINKVNGLHLLEFRDDIRSNYWFYALSCSNDYYLNRDELINYLSENQIQSRPIWGLISEQVPYKECQTYRIEKAKQYLDTVVNLPCSSNLTQDQVLRVIQCLKNK